MCRWALFSANQLLTTENGGKLRLNSISLVFNALKYVRNRDKPYPERQNYTWKLSHVYTITNRNLLSERNCLTRIPFNNVGIDGKQIFLSFFLFRAFFLLNALSHKFRKLECDRLSVFHFERKKELLSKEDIILTTRSFLFYFFFLTIFLIFGWLIGIRWSKKWELRLNGDDLDKQTT